MHHFLIKGQINENIKLKNEKENRREVEVQKIHRKSPIMVRKRFAEYFDSGGRFLP